MPLARSQGPRFESRCLCYEIITPLQRAHTWLETVAYLSSLLMQKSSEIPGWAKPNPTELARADFFCRLKRWETIVRLTITKRNLFSAFKQKIGHYPYLFHIRKTAMQVARMTRQQTATITENTWSWAGGARGPSWIKIIINTMFNKYFHLNFPVT